MKLPLFVLIFTLCVACTGLAQTSNSSNATEANGISSATCQLNFDAAGHKTAVMTKSTGSKVLDGYIVQSAGEYLNGPRSTSIPISVMYKVINVPTSHGKAVVRVAALRPPYPLQARVSRVQGNGLVKASFDESGHIVSAAMAQSTGSDILDSNTVNFALKRWRSSGGEKVTTVLPIDYRLR